MNPATTENADQTLGEASWFENETFWETIYPFIFVEERFTTAEAEVAELAKLTGTPFRKVLDLCCGPGRHSIPLARQGAQVTAVDRSPFLLEKARSRAELEKLAQYGKPVKKSEAAPVAKVKKSDDVREPKEPVAKAA